eukprot:m.849985 g.849985  ORF g.849985 m.849985 type:complete len:417 (+) comp23491_c0_seq18:3954-5204(+)
MTYRNLMLSPWIDSTGVNLRADKFVSNLRQYVPSDEWVNTTICTRPDDYCAEEAPGRVPDTLCTTYSTVPPDEFYYALTLWIDSVGLLDMRALVCYVNAPGTPTHGTQTDCSNIVQAWPSGDPNREAHSKNVTLGAILLSPNLINQRSTEDFVEAIRDTRRRIDACSNKPTQSVIQIGDRWSYLTGYTFQYYSQYLDIKTDLYELCAYAIAGVCLVTLIFQCSIRCSLILAVELIMMTFEVAGLVAVIPGLKINAFSVVNICISIGMGIEFSAHLVHHFLVAEGETRRERVVLALEFMGPPLVHGFVTSLISTLFLVVADVAFIRSYYFGMFLGYLVLDCLNGLVLLPVLLSMFGDRKVVIPEKELKKRQTVKVCVLLRGQLGKARIYTTYNRQPTHIAVSLIRILAHTIARKRRR